MVMPHLKKPIPNPPVERPVRGFSDCKEGGSFGALGSLGLVGVALREHESNGWGDLVGVVLAQENNFIVGLRKEPSDQQAQLTRRRKTAQVPIAVWPPGKGYGGMA
jgi:hypothetical protein